jgi:plastocyanin
MRRLGCSLVAIATLLLLPGEAVASGGGGCYSPITDRATSTVKMKNFCFDPAVVRIDEGEEIAWTNLDEVKHNLYAGPIWGSRTMRESDRTTVSFERAGVFTYVCAYHPGMVGTVVVGDGYSGPVIRGEKAGIHVTGFERAEEVAKTAALGFSPTAPVEMQVISAKAAPAAADAGARSSLWGPVIALLVIAALCLFALVTGRSARRREKEEDDILRR